MGMHTLLRKNGAAGEIKKFGLDSSAFTIDIVFLRHISAAYWMQGHNRMSIFEIAMLLCFGFAWPFSIIKSWKSRTTKGKSLTFLLIVIAGYTAGILHKIFYNYDIVVWFYVANMTMVAADTVLYYRNWRLSR
jgi:hypothetical protein